MSGLRKYAAGHQFLENITCFCSLLSGTSTPVKLFTVHKHDSEHRGDQCLGCKYWDQGKEDLGCKYFGAYTVSSLHPFTHLCITVNITRLFENHPPQDTFPYPETPANTKGTLSSLHLYFAILTYVIAEQKRMQAAQRRAGKFAIQLTLSLMADIPPRPPPSLFSLPMAASAEAASYAEGSTCRAQRPDGQSM